MLAGLGSRLLARGAEVSPATPDPPPDAGEARDEFGVALLDHATDPLVALAQYQPEAAVHFLRAVLLLGLLMGLLLPAPCAVLVGAAWEAYGQCNRPLRLWALVHCALNLLQAPIRLHFYLKLRRRPDAEGVRQLVESGMWQGCRSLSIAGYAWFVLGVVWLINSDFHGPCRGLSGLTFGLVAVAIMKPVLTLAAFRLYVPPHLRVAESSAKVPRGATQEVIDSLAFVHYADDGREASCAVCLAEFQEGEGLRQLPCCHKFHAPCVDRWLARSSRCPLCVREVDASPAARACSRY